MNEALFIDLVDFDWGWRALDRSYGLFIAEGVRFQHALGEGAFQAFGLRGGIPSPIRHYYQTRNTLYLLTQPHVPTTWKLRQIINLAIKIVVFPIFIAPRLERLTHFSRGVIDAISVNMGPKQK
jgi:rhamnosyltransferase